MHSGGHRLVWVIDVERIARGAAPTRRPATWLFLRHVATVPAT
jgi:hypothetical protein